MYATTNQSSFGWSGHAVGRSVGRVTTTTTSTHFLAVEVEHGETVDDEDDEQQHDGEYDLRDRSSDSEQHVLHTLGALDDVLHTLMIHSRLVVGRVHARTNGRMDGRMDGYGHRWIDGWRDGWLDGWVEGWLVGWLDGSMGGG